MPDKALREVLLPLRAFILSFGPLLLLALALLWAAYAWLQPQPPSRVVLATGVAQGAYAEFGSRYAERLRRHGITVELRATQGAAENLALLRDPNSGVDLAFVQGGADAARPGQPDPDAGLVSLGSLFHEPLWLFYRESSAQRLAGRERIDGLTQLAGWTLNVGAPGSGVPPLMQLLLEANRIDPAAIRLQQQATTPAVVDLLEGRIDALVLASAPESQMVQMLLQTPGIRLLDFAQAEAYSRRFAFMSPVLLPRGVVDLARDLPPADVRLVAPTATLLARDSLHPALVQLFVQAAQQVHGGAGWFQRKGEFPNTANSERPLAPEAQRIYRSGPPWLQQYLPFWLANLADRMWVALLAIGAVLIPLSRILPPLVEFRIRSRVFRWYGQLRAVEHAQGRRPRAELLAELDQIERRVGEISVPLSYADELYALRTHIQGVRQRLQRD
jgi:ABC-type nitrate/sulfonate/bicarbonate transport system substrate-binding protein